MPLEVIPGSEGSVRADLRCLHQSGVLYVVRSPSNWVCSQEDRLPHALAGLFGELATLRNEAVDTLMQKWGLYFRPRSLEEQALSPDP